MIDINGEYQPWAGNCPARTLDGHLWIIRGERSVQTQDGLGHVPGHRIYCQHCLETRDIPQFAWRDRYARPRS